MSVLITRDRFALNSVNSKSSHCWLVELHNDPAVLYNVTHPTPINYDDHIVWWNKLGLNEQRFIFTVDGEKAGFTKFYRIDSVNSNCDLGADLQINFRGRGFAQPMWELMLHHAFITLNLHRVGLTTASYNTIGQRVYEKLGFMEEGRKRHSLYRDGVYYDELCMSMTKEEYNAPLTGL